MNIIFSKKRCPTAEVCNTVLFLLLCFPVHSEETKGDNKLSFLPNPSLSGDNSFEKVLSQRRSVRNFAHGSLSIQEISQLVWSAQGITDRGNAFRTAPSAGATFPLEIYLMTWEGVFHYLPEKHALDTMQKGDFRFELAKACFSQMFIKDAPLIIIFSAIFGRTTSRYGTRGEKYIYIEAGHAAQNIHLQAVAMNLGSVPIGAFSDDNVHGLLGLPENEQVLYIIPIGKKRDSGS
ncbi:MAG: SagB/ThcOx family dehydrogenase [Candidatus Aureabacteria bacterium]|nr:SagB/ThcOx family dehydrogenase [Candidatus Auribacterota bacterium]